MLSRSPIQFDLWKQLWGKDTLPEESKSRKGHIGPRWAASQRKRAGRILSQDTSRALLKLQISKPYPFNPEKLQIILCFAILFSFWSCLFPCNFSRKLWSPKSVKYSPDTQHSPWKPMVGILKKSFLEVIRQFSWGSCQLNFHFPPFPDSAPVRHQAIHESYRTGPRNVVLGKGPVAFSFGKKMHLLSNWVPFPPQFFGVNIQKYVKPPPRIFSYGCVTQSGHFFRSIAAKVKSLSEASLVCKSVPLNFAHALY